MCGSKWSIFRVGRVTCGVQLSSAFIKELEKRSEEENDKVC